MSDRAALLRAIRDQPDDDTPRLVFADYLDETGEPEWAELIRLQIRLAREGRGRKYDEREDDLEGQLRSRLPVWKGIVWKLIERGFPTVIEVRSTRAFEEHGTEAITDYPVEAVMFQAQRPGRNAFAGLAGALADTQALALVRRLVLTGVPQPARAAAALLESPHLAGLNALYWRSAGLTDAAAVALAGSPYLTGLRVLYLSGNRITARGGLALAASSRLEHLDRLDLSGNDLDLPVIATLRERFGERVRV